MARLTVRKTTVLLLAAALSVALLSGCQSKTPAQVSQSETDQADHAHDIPYSTAFISDAVPEGSATPNTISFYMEDDSGNATVRNVSPEEIAAFSAQMEHLPRTTHFNRFIPENLHSLFPILDYSIYHGYSKICIPTTEFEGTDVIAADRYLYMMYHINDKGVSGRTVSSFENEAGETVNYVFVGIMGLTTADASRYREAIDRARKIVDTVPDDYGEYETALYLYQYLTDHVRYHPGDYYADTDWNLLYDALINQSTVCAGYSEALYVLYNLAGIECFSIGGYVYAGSNSALTETYNGSHIWNVAKLNGVYYEFDPTWDEGEAIADYHFFAVSTEDLLYYYPRNIDAITDEYCEPRTESLFPRVETDDDSLDYLLLSAAFTIYNSSHTNPLHLLRLFGRDVADSDLKDAEDGWKITPVSYSFFHSAVCRLISEELADAFFSGYIRDEGGKVAFNPERPAGETYRFCGMDGEEPVVYIFDAQGRFIRGRVDYQIGDNGLYYIIDALAVTQK